MSQRHTSLDFPYQTPGALRGGAVLAVHSRQAARLLQGRPRKNGSAAIVGLFGFARALRPIHEGTAEHDPYADWWLTKINDELRRADSILTAINTSLQESMDPTSGFSIAEVTSELPMLVELRFAGSEAYAVARTLASFDRIVLQALSARHLGLLSNEAMQDLIDQGGTALRRLFFTPMGYRRTGVTHADIRVDNRIARQARERMGLLPDEFARLSANTASVLDRGDSRDGDDAEISTVITAAQ